jgi:hypothetical protein
MKKILRIIGYCIAAPIAILILIILFICGLSKCLDDEATGNE